MLISLYIPLRNRIVMRHLSHKDIHKDLQETLKYVNIGKYVIFIGVL